MNDDGFDVDSPQPSTTTDHDDPWTTTPLTASDLCTALDTLSIKINDASRMLEIAVEKMGKGARTPDTASDDGAGIRKLRQEWEQGQHILSAIHSLTASQNHASEVGNIDSKFSVRSSHPI